MYVRMYVCILYMRMYAVFHHIYIYVYIYMCNVRQGLGQRVFGT